ncbi:hypothetical protein [Paracoccus sp. PAR01]|uniref:hypothetical protein n=1 Tax=Paracoccus sp. PAR01 TaxID=2769282 RepID=UPI001782D69B|nr:hypothetical protein [Paracoccus sp. PAR01]MBD9529141.1 hypothetical protein [Paracoccus sp. PAR01]
MKERCRIWDTIATAQPTHRDGYEIDSHRVGGRYFISSTAAKVLESRDDNLRPRLTTWLIDQRRHGTEVPKIVSGTIDLVKRAPALGVQERAERLLEYFETESSFIGDEVCYAADEATSMEMLAWTESLQKEEVEFLLEYLKTRGFISIEHVGDFSGEVKVTIDGHVHMADLRQKSVASTQGFVAMWFDDSMRSVYEDAIAPAIRDSGYDPVRIDGREHNNKIDDEIIAEIRRSRFVVSDFTQGDSGARGGVYYEAGFAHGLGLPVIFTCRSDVLEKIHFDTRQYNHIAWSTPEELKERLAKRISATLGDGPKRKAG